VDREGVRIAVAEQSAYGLYLSRTIKHARLVLTQGVDGSFDVFVAQKLEALAGSNPACSPTSRKLPGSRSSTASSRRSSRRSARPRPASPAPRSCARSSKR